MKLPSYPKVYNIGHPLVAELFEGDVTVQEKVDGSQFSFMLTAVGDLVFQSRGAEINPDDAGKLFAPAVRTVREIADRLVTGWVYRAEAIYAPRHNTLTYGRAPRGGLVLFDVMTAPENYAREVDLDVIGHLDDLGLEYVPTFYIGPVTDLEQLKELLDRESFLGGAKVEGIVVKNYLRFGLDGKPLMGKYVSEAFKERHSRQWKADHPGRGDVVLAIVESLKTEARWQKAVQHLDELCQLRHAPEDIGPLLKELNLDTLQEEKEFIKLKLFEWAWPQIAKGLTRGFAQWYKDQLAQRAFDP